jgi:hypothetical protein
MIVTTIPKVVPSVTISVIPGDTVCEYVAATIIPAPVNGGPSPTYTWIKNGIPATTGPVYHYMPTNGDNILCSMHSNYECLIVDSAYSANNINMTVIPVQVPTLTVTAHPGDTIRTGSNDTLVATVINGGTAPAYQWKINGVAVPGATNDTFIYSSFASNDTVTCVVTSGNFCNGGPIDTFKIITDTGSILGIGQNIFYGGEISVEPDPNVGIFTINGSITSAADNAIIKITDMLGRVIYSHVFPIQKGRLSARIALNDQLPDGVYLIHVIGDNLDMVSRFLLSR